MTSQTVASSNATPWQLQMFSKTLKKQQKVQLLTEMVQPVANMKCLLVTNGDNNGAMNYRFRESGGEWTWAEFEQDGIAGMEDLLGEHVHHATVEAFPFEDNAFDRVIVIDVHEHLTEHGALNREIARVVAPGGLAVITTPNGATWLPVALLKRVIGMGPASYGHVVQGYTSSQLADMLDGVGLKPEDRRGYSRFFTELVELAINFAYVKILSKKKKGPKVEQGTIAPGSKEQLQAVQKTYKMYSRIYPIIRAFSAFDVLIPGRGGYAVAVAGRKEQS